MILVQLATDQVSSPVVVKRQTMTKVIRCKWCEEGRVPNEKDEHWIVKSIIPASIKIVKCKLAKTGDSSGA